MELGEKLRRARLEKGLSQRQLCGDRITRNMLSQIENGQAKPSMDTLRYLAAGLGKPVSFFLEEDTVASPDLPRILAARRLFGEGKWAGALETLEGYRPGDEILDPEYWHLLSLCAYGQAEQAAREGKGPYAEALIRQSLDAGKETIYGGAGLRPLLLRAVLGEQEPGALNEALGELYEAAGRDGARLARLLARKALNDQRPGEARNALELVPEGAEKALLLGESFLQEKNYLQAAEAYRRAERLLEETGGDPRITYEPLETCYREMEDYKSAYFYAAKQK